MQYFPNTNILTKLLSKNKVRWKMRCPTYVPVIEDSQSQISPHMGTRIDIVSD